MVERELEEEVIDRSSLVTTVAEAEGLRFFAAAANTGAELCRGVAVVTGFEATEADDDEEEPLILLLVTAVTARFFGGKLFLT